MASNPERKKLLAFEISCYPIGSTIIVIREPELLSHVRNAFECFAIEQSSQLGIPFPEVEALLSLYSGNPRRIEEAKALDAANGCASTQVQHEYIVRGSREGFDWFSDEGLCVLVPFVKERTGWITLEQRISAPLKPHIAEGLLRVRNGAKRADVRLMLFLVCPEKRKKNKFNNCCDEYVEIARCEPDPETDVAFSVNCVGIRNLNGLGIGKYMCGVTLANGQFRRTITPFISKELRDRIIWILRGQGRTLKEIGRIVDQDKSTVFRHLEELPKPKRVDMPKGWLTSYLEFAGLEPVVNEYEDEAESEDDEKREDEADTVEGDDDAE